MSVPVEWRPAGLGFRLMASLYDALVLAALWLLVAAFVVGARRGEAVPPGTIWFELLLAAVAAGYFALSWRVARQTLGAAPWRLVVLDAEGRPLGWGLAFARWALASLGWVLGGIGYLWCLFDPERQALHDRLLGTRLWRRPPPPRRKANTAKSERDSSTERDA